MVKEDAVAQDFTAVACLPSMKVDKELETRLARPEGCSLIASDVNEEIQPSDWQRWADVHEYMQCSKNCRCRCSASFLPASMLPTLASLLRRCMLYL
jgi:hypothetical protein